MKNFEAFWLWVGEHYILGFFLFLIAMEFVLNLIRATFRFVMVLARGWPSVTQMNPQEYAEMLKTLHDCD